jgi:hypothetical protein
MPVRYPLRAKHNKGFLDNSAVRHLGSGMRSAILAPALALAVSLGAGPLAAAPLLPAPVPLPTEAPAILLPTLPALPGLPAEPVRPALTARMVEGEVVRMRDAFAREVKRPVASSPANDRAWIGMARTALAADPTGIDHPQLIVVVDRNPAVQSLRVIMARPAGPWEIVGGAHVSSGQAGRFDHYLTPLGVFRHTDAILGYRAQGTYNENRIRGLGAKGMRVWDFGWQSAQRTWGTDRSEGQIRFMMHATDPDVLEARLGRPASQGCVRLSADVNRFLDLHGVLDADYERVAVTDIRYRALLLPNRQPSMLAGNILVVIDTGHEAAPKIAGQASPKG